MPKKAPDVAAIRARLRAAIPRPFCELRHESAWQLLVATILAAQSTDRTINSVTPSLFRRWPTPRALADASQQDVEAAVTKTGFFRNKAKAIRAAALAVAEQHGGEVPRTMDALVALPGVGRKTANVVLGTAYGVAAGMIVDTHSGRVARRLGLTKHEDPEDVETDLCKHFPKSEWIDGSHRLTLHGRYVCVAKAPRCTACPLAEVCPSRDGAPEGTWQVRAAAEDTYIRGKAENVPA